jgi:hydroxymethylbilane synthase
MKIIIGSRGSDLALWQAHFVKDALEQEGHEIVIKIIKTRGDQIQHLSFDKMEGKGFFTKEIEEALLAKEIDLAVHSHKDLETTNPVGLTIGAVSYRENPSDLLIMHPAAFQAGAHLNLKEQAIVGTSSARRQTQLLRFREDLTINDLRGNVPTRIEKLRKGNYDAIVLAQAGVTRLKIDLSAFKTVELDPVEFVPAPAQGVLGLQIREEDTELQSALSVLHDEEVEKMIDIERGVMRQLNGGCQLPLGVYAQRNTTGWDVYTSYASQKDVAAELNKYVFTHQDTDIVDVIVSDLVEEDVD